MPIPPAAHVGVASVNQTVGDWSGNAARIREVIDAARSVGVRLLLLPEMCLSGYSLGDRLLRQGTVDRSWDRLLGLADATTGLAVGVGLPLLYEGVLYNAMALLADGRLVGLTAKENLAIGDVEYENRYFAPWVHGRLVSYRGPDGTIVPLGTQMFALPGLGTVAFEICEDAWKSIRPGSTYALAGAEILMNPSASWFTIGKHQVRRRMVRQISREDLCIYLYASLLGCDSTRLIFDGSLFIAANGRIEAEGRRFVFDRDWELLHHVVDLAEIRHARMELGSWRDQLGRLQTGAIGTLPTVTPVAGDFASTSPPPPPLPYWLPSTPGHPDPSLAYLEHGALKGRAIADPDLCHLELELALALALRDYTRKSGITSCCVALSGGRDSAMVALLVRQMLRYQDPTASDDELRRRVRATLICAYMATDHSSDATRAAARAVAEQLGATYYEGSIQSALESAHATIERMTGVQLDWSNPDHDLPLQNIQARLRGMLIWMIANLNRSLLLVTSNKSEAAVGYTTMDGDTSGGLAPIADVPKSLIKLYLAWARRFHNLPGFDAVDAMPASAELRPRTGGRQEQTDEADLMPFAVLDQLMFAFVQLGLAPVDILRRFWPYLRSFYPEPAAAAAAIRKFVRLFCQAQWKRERFAISFRVTAFDLDPKTGFRFPPVQAPFTEELAELDRLVEEIQAGRATLDD
ncbi:MAG: NAD(+) synthase [Isosphaeraceae bacterium]|jgi:NAD+ synthase (glutamine-hydrolysing)|nr:MAG: NAD(+) synthase [Isosphaeraceae bacterium]